MAFTSPKRFTPKPKKPPKPRVGVVVGKPKVGIPKLGPPKGIHRPPAPAAAAKPGLGPDPAAATAAPAAEGPRPGQHLEPDAQYTTDVDRANRKETSALGSLEGQEAGVKHDFGIDDPTNPFSKAEGLKKSFLARQKANSASLASRGQLYSGSHERAVSRTRRDEEEARAQLRQTYSGLLGQFGDAKTGVKYASEEERAAATEAWMNRSDDADYDLGPTDEEVGPEEDLVDVDEETGELKERTVPDFKSNVPELEFSGPQGGQGLPDVSGMSPAARREALAIMSPKAQALAKARGQTVKSTVKQGSSGLGAQPASKPTPKGMTPAEARRVAARAGKKTEKLAAAKKVKAQSIVKKGADALGAPAQAKLAPKVAQGRAKVEAKKQALAKKVADQAAKAAPPKAAKKVKAKAKAKPKAKKKGR